MQYKCSSLQSYEEISPLGFFGLYFSSSLINQIKRAVNGFPTININIQLYKKRRHWYLLVFSIYIQNDLTNNQDELQDCPGSEQTANFNS